MVPSVRTDVIVRSTDRSVMEKKRVIIGVSGASGVCMSKKLLQELKACDYETHLVITDGAKLTWKCEMAEPIENMYSLADYVYDEHDYAAAIASGSFRTEGMIIIPCSMKSVAGIVSGYADNLLLRAADVCLKEWRKVILVPREMPLGKIHLRNLSEAADLGCAIIPPVLTFYNEPETIDDQVRHIVGKILMLMGIEPRDFTAWEGK